MKQGGRCAALLMLILYLGLAAPLPARDSEENKIDHVIEAVIDAYRHGDLATMGRYHASDVRFVPADYNPPVQGWAEVAARYQQAFAQLSGLELMRENTQIERRGKVAWAFYQWRFAGVAGNETLGALGHTTLILEKRGGDWIIVYNHTSALPAPPAEPAESPAPTRPN